MTVVPELGGTTTVVLFGGGGLLLLMQAEMSGSKHNATSTVLMKYSLTVVVLGRSVMDSPRTRCRPRTAPSVSTVLHFRARRSRLGGHGQALDPRGEGIERVTENVAVFAGAEV